MYEQPTASATATVYVPVLKFENTWVVCVLLTLTVFPFGYIKVYTYGVVPPITETVIVPPELEQVDP
jgi:hypothetical protein